MVKTNSCSQNLNIKGNSVDVWITSHVSQLDLYIH